jgi:hypothetical protein
MKRHASQQQRNLSCRNSNQFFYVVVRERRNSKGNGHALQRAMQDGEEKEEKKEK